MRALVILAGAVLDLYLADSVEPLRLKLALAGAAVLALATVILPVALKLIGDDSESQTLNRINRELDKANRRDDGSG